MDILKDLDKVHPKIVKENNKFIWINEKNDNDNNNNNNDNDEQKIFEQDLWLNEYFIKDTKKYIEAKANKDILNLTLSEYILSQIE